MVKREEKVTQIINAATDELLAKGLDAASMHNIAEQAGVSKRTLYKYYPSKDELYWALIDEILDKMEEIHNFEYKEEVSVKEFIEEVVDHKIEMTLNDYTLKISKIAIGEMFKGKTPKLEQIERLNKSEQLFTDWIQEAQKAGKLKTDIEPIDMATQFHSILKGQIFWPILTGMMDKKDLDLPKVKKTTISFFINSFCN